MRSRTNGLRSLQARAVLGRDDEAELVRVVLRALEEGVAIGIITVRVVEPSGLAVAGDAVALDVAQMGACRAEVAGPLARVARPDDDAAAAGRDQAGAGEDARRHAAPRACRAGCGRAAAPCRRRPWRPARGCAWWCADWPAPFGSRMRPSLGSKSSAAMTLSSENAANCE